jgi:hypothetical protein
MDGRGEKCQDAKRRDGVQEQIMSKMLDAWKVSGLRYTLAEGRGGSVLWELKREGSEEWTRSFEWDREGSRRICRVG